VTACLRSEVVVARETAFFEKIMIECARPIPFVICTDNPALNGRSQTAEMSLAAQIAEVEVNSFLSSQWEIASRAAFDFANPAHGEIKSRQKSQHPTASVFD